MASRNLSDLTPTLEKKARKFLALCEKRGLPVHITCTRRSIHEHEALYAQGREPLEKVNELRKAVGLWALKEEENQRPVTWTLKSRHIVFDEKERARAFDVALVRDKQFVWDLKVDINENDLNDWEEIGRIGESAGLEWGGRWAKPDRPHFQEAEHTG
jgi:peptidoglycan L-alanyl-D-glutamate endopeptidase CwlK